jgi:hypothetical protein
MHYDSFIFGLSLLAASFLFGRFFSPHPTGDSEDLRRHNDRTPASSEESPVVTAIKSLLERTGLTDEIVADTTSIPTLYTWKRTSGGKMRSIMFLPTDRPQAEYIFSYFKKEGDEIIEGKWMWDFEHSVAAFARFLIEWEDRRTIANDHVKYRTQQVKTSQ